MDFGALLGKRGKNTNPSTMEDFMAKMVLKTQYGMDDESIEKILKTRRAMSRLGFDMSDKESVREFLRRCRKTCQKLDGAYKTSLSVYISTVNSIILGKDGDDKMKIIESLMNIKTNIPSNLLEVSKEKVTREEYEEIRFLLQLIDSDKIVNKGRH